MFTSGGTPTRTPRRVSSKLNPAGLNSPATTEVPSTVPRSRAPRASRVHDSPAASIRQTRRTAGSTIAGSVMEVDEMEKRPSGIEVVDKVLVRDAAYVVLERKGLPVELEGVITMADPYTDPLRASLDPVTGFAFLVSREYCLVWNWSRRSSSATTYIFPLPPILSLPAVVSAFSPLSFAAFVPATTQPNQREPGLLIASPTGEIRYWENVSMALSGVERWKGVETRLDEGELIRGITLHSSTSFLLSTTQSRIFVVAIASVGGRMEIKIRPFDRAVGWAGSVWNFFGGKGSDPRKGILAIALTSSPSSDEREGKIAFAVADRLVQVWKLSGRDDEGGEKLLIEQDLFAGILEALTGAKPTNEMWALNELKAEILDAQSAADGSLVLLVSHLPTGSNSSNSPLAYAIVSLDVGAVQNSVTVLGIRRLSYSARPDPRPLSSPRLSLPGGATAFVVFVDAVVIVSLAQGSTFEETFPLRSSTNRFLGITSSSTSPTPSISLLTSTASILSIDVTAPARLTLDSRTSAESKTRKLKSKIEQAIFFGIESEENPLAFDLLPDFQGDLIAAAEAVSAEILSSSSANMPLIIDLRAQLADRLTRARALIQYISSNGLLGKLSQTSRRRLSWDAERLAAAASLWQHQNGRLSEHPAGDTLLAMAISAYMIEVGEGFGDDTVRTFFRTKVSAIGAISEHITKLVKTALASTDSATRSATLHESNALILLVYKSISRHRSETLSTYGIDSRLLPTEAWSSRIVLLDSLVWHVEATATLIQERSRDFGNAIDDDPRYGGRARGASADPLSQQALQVDLRQQMADLAGFVFSMFEERLLFLSTAVSDVNAAEYRVVHERYISLRPRIITALVSIDKVKQAYELAERHRDFRSLVGLCNDPVHGSTTRIRSLMEKYGEEFAFALYHFYVEKGQLQTLMGQEELYRPLLTKFLDSTDNPRIDWINDIAISRFDHATESLVKVSADEKGAAEKRLMLSLAKLNRVAQASYETIKTEAVQRAIELIDDSLDLVNTQQALAIALNQLSRTEAFQSVDQQAALITTRTAPTLGDRSAFAELYSQFTARLLRNEAISAEDTIDLLTMKENHGMYEGDYAAALDILVRAKNIPKARHAIALQSIWRRVYLRDDWESLRSSSGLTDEDVARALQSTALYATLLAAGGAEISSTLFLLPEQTLFCDTSEEIAARFPDLSPEAIDALLVDFERESALVLDAVRSHSLNEYCGEVTRLLADGLREAHEDARME